MSGLIISTDRMISSSEARKRFGKLLDDISESEKNYYVILENGKVAALLVHPDWLKDKQDEEFPDIDLEKLRREEGRYTKEISEALEHLEKMDKKNLPKLLQ